MDEVEGWWITANVRRVPMSACRVEDRFFNLCGELCIMENEMKIHSQLDETKLKLDSSSLYNEVDPTGPAPVQCVSSRSPQCLPTSVTETTGHRYLRARERRTHETYQRWYRRHNACLWRYPSCGMVHPCMRAAARVTPQTSVVPTLSLIHI